MDIPAFQFNDDLSREQFLDTYWQKRPALLRSAIEPAACQLSAEELAGLACEEAVESRLIQQHSKTDWALQHGPFDSRDFTRLPASHWTLLVQDVDKYVTSVAELLDAFDFLPDWRLDDIMISYATHEGGVGPHTDNYDVFLIQAQGKRRWRLSYQPYTEEDLLPDCALRILQTFRTDVDWILEPGDVLYLPPGIPHWGTAMGECMTWSVGMRGASDVELATAWLEQLPLHEGRPHLRDTVDANTQNPSWLNKNDIIGMRNAMANVLPADTPAFRLWLGRFLTEPKPGFEVTPDQHPAPDAIQQWLNGRLRLRRHPWVRLALIPVDDTRIALCAQGEAVE